MKPKTIRGSSEVSLALAFLIAVTLQGGVLVAKGALPEPIQILLFERGWVQHATLFLTFLAIGILVLKSVGLALQRRSLRWPAVPPEERSIDAENVARLLERAEQRSSASAVPGVARSFWVARVAGLLRVHAARLEPTETASAAEKASEADADAVSASYSMVKVLVWAIPIVGFIGTVVGIGDAVVGFSDSLKHADQLDAIKGSLAKVTLGLSIAFDTTLLSLVTSIVVMLPMTYLQKAEERLTRDLDDAATAVLGLVSHPAAALPAETAEAPAQDDWKRMVVEIVGPSMKEMVEAHTALLAKMAADRAEIAEARAITAAAQASMLEAQASFAKFQASLAESHAALKADLASVAGALGGLAPSVDRAVDRLEEATALAERAGGHVSKVEDQLCREIGASRQLLQLLAAGLHDANGAGPKLKSKNGVNGANGATTQET